MPGPKSKNPFDSETPSRGQRVDALGERLSELRTKLGVLASDTAAESKSRASSHEIKHDAKPASNAPKGGATLPPEANASDDEKLALTVFNTMKGDPRRLRQFVQSLARLEAAAAKHTAEGAKKNEDKA
jgi:hypothetical protein